VQDRARARTLPELGGLELIEAVHVRPRFPRHAHPTYALGLIHWGLNRFRYRGAWHVAPAGALCTVTPDEVHAVEPAGGAGFAYRCLYPPLALLQEVAASLSDRAWRPAFFLPPVIEDPEAVRLAASLFGSIEAGAPPLTAQSLLGSLLAHVVARHAQPHVAPDRPPPAGRALALVRDLLVSRLGENVTLDELAAAAGLERFALLRGFARAYGLPPHAWVIQERVRKAQVLLRLGRSPAEVATDLGFADQSHLSRHLKRLTGVTPGGYRRQGFPRRPGPGSSP
jgi:AraC-like DNA-binding protein